MDNTAQNGCRITAVEYLRLTPETNQPTELLDGEIVSFAAPSIRHQRIAGRLHTAFENHIRKNKGKYEPFMSPTDVRLDDLNVVQPDVFVTCHPEKLEEQYLDGAPDLTVEISSSNKSDDFDRKLWLYRKSGVREYWIIDPRSERVFVYFFEKDSAPQVYGFHTPIPVNIWEGRLTVTISELESLS